MAVGRLIPEADPFQMFLPFDVMKEIFSWVVIPADIANINLTGRGSRFLNNDQFVWERRFQYCYPDLYKKYTSPGYKAVLRKIDDKPINWRERFVETYLSTCVDLPACEIPDYWIIRRCQPTEIAQLLNQQDWFKRLFIVDMQGCGIWHFISEIPEEDRQQTVRDLLFAKLRTMPSISEEVRSPYNTSHYYREMGIVVTHLAGSQYSVLVEEMVYEIVCNQPAVFSAWLSGSGRSKKDRLSMINDCLGGCLLLAVVHQCKEMLMLLVNLHKELHIPYFEECLSGILRNKPIYPKLQSFYELANQWEVSKPNQALRDYYYAVILVLLKSKSDHQPGGLMTMLEKGGFHLKREIYNDLELLDAAFLYSEYFKLPDNLLYDLLLETVRCGNLDCVRFLLKLNKNAELPSQLLSEALAWPAIFQELLIRFGHPERKLEEFMFPARRPEQRGELISLTVLKWLPTLNVNMNYFWHDQYHRQFRWRYPFEMKHVEIRNFVSLLQSYSLYSDNEEIRQDTIIFICREILKNLIKCQYFIERRDELGHLSVRYVSALKQLLALNVDVDADFAHPHERIRSLIKQITEPSVLEQLREIDVLEIEMPIVAEMPPTWCRIL